MTAALLATAQAFVGAGCGLLAMDVSTSTCNKRFTAAGVPWTEAEQRTYREFLVTTPGAKALAPHPGEEVTQGLDGLRARLHEHAQMGARFAKWRATNICRGSSSDRSAWPLVFSFGRALQQPALLIWQGQAANVIAAQRALVHKATCNGAALHGSYMPSMEHTPALQSAS